MSDQFVVHYGVPEHEISIHTLSRSLTSLSDAFGLVNDILDPGSEFDVNIVAIAPGSFRVALSPKTKKLLGKAWDKGGKELVIGIVLLIVAAKLNGEPPSVTHYHGDVIYQTNNYEISMPKECKPEIDKAFESEDLDEKVVESFEAINVDANITSFGITETTRDLDPVFLIERNDFHRLIVRRQRDEEKKTRVISKRLNVRVLKTVFERGNRKWEFVHRNQRISAPVLDQNFFDRLLKHEIVFGNGDYMDVTIKVTQEWNELIETWVDSKYAVETVHRHISGPQQQQMF